MKFLLLWFVGALIYFLTIKDDEFYIEGIIVPLIFCFFTILTIRKLSDRYKTLFAYLLFFSTGILTFFGIIKPLTGSISESPNLLLFGFSFYTLSLAYLAKNIKSINIMSGIEAVGISESSFVFLLNFISQTPLLISWLRWLVSADQ